MSDDVANPVVEPEIKPEISILAEETTPKQEESQAPEVMTEQAEPSSKVIPKERFDEVWARMKREESERKALQAEIQREREERIRLEERVKVKEETQSQPEYTWDQLEAGIAEGRWTRAQAQEYKDQQTEKRLTQKLAKQKELEVSNSRVLGEIEQYKSLVPEVNQYGTESRQKVEREYAYLIRNGAPDNYTTQLAALRAALGDPETIKSRNTTKRVLIEKEPFMETHAPSGKEKPKQSFKDSLPAHVVEHYQRLAKGGIFRGKDGSVDWKAVEEVEKSRRRA